MILRKLKGWSLYHGLLVHIVREGDRVPEVLESSRRLGLARDVQEAFLAGSSLPPGNLQGSLTCLILLATELPVTRIRELHLPFLCPPPHQSTFQEC